MYKRTFKEYFGRNRKALYMIFGILLVSTLSLTIVYAALNVTLNIVGNAEVVASNWDIHLENPKVKNGSVHNTVPTISGNTLSFNATLTTPGDYYEFVVDVVNSGTIDAMIDSVVKTPELTVEQAKYFKYEVSYQNGESINTKQTIKKGTTTPIKVRIEYRRDIVASDLPSTNQNLSLKLSLVYVQSDESGSSVSNNGNAVAFANGDVNKIGTIVTIGTEQFYTIGTDEDNVKLLSKLNITLDNNPIQSDSAGITEYSSINYSGDFYGQYEGSLVSLYVSRYVDYLTNLGVVPKSSGIVSLEDVISLGCNINEHTCTNAPNWVYSTSYWTNTYDQNGDSLAYVDSNSSLNYYEFYGGFGVRPVIVIPKVQINDYYIIEKKMIEFTINMLETYQAEEGMTWAEWVNSEYNVDEYYILNNRITRSETDTMTYKGVRVNPIDIIMSNANYICSATNPA